MIEKLSDPDKIMSWSITDIDRHLREQAKKINEIIDVTNILINAHSVTDTK